MKHEVRGFGVEVKLVSMRVGARTRDSGTMDWIGGGGWRALVVLVVMALPGVGCRRLGPVAKPARTLDAMAGDYVKLALALGERDPDSLDFAVVAEPLRAEMHKDYLALDAIGAKAEALRGEVGQVQAADEETRGRAEFLSAQLGAMTARVGMLRGRTMEFDEEARALFAGGGRVALGGGRGGGFGGGGAGLLPRGEVAGSTPAERYAAYDRRFVVPPDKLASVMTAALGACRAQTLRFVALPAGESVDLQFVRNQPWSGFSRFRGGAHSSISLNLDFPVTVDDVLELACHEGYPGHHVFNSLREQALVREKRWPEATVQTTFSPQSYVSEAAAAYGARLAFTLAERTAVERDVLFPLAGLKAAEAERYVRVSSLVRGLASAEPAVARDYLDGRLEFARAGDVLARETLMAHAEPVLLYENEYRSYMLAYTDGPERVGVWLGAPGSEANYGQGDSADVSAAQRQQQWGRYKLLTGGMVWRLP